MRRERAEPAQLGADPRGRPHPAQAARGGKRPRQGARGALLRRERAAQHAGRKGGAAADPGRRRPPPLLQRAASHTLLRHVARRVGRRQAIHAAGLLRVLLRPEAERGFRRAAAAQPAARRGGVQAAHRRFGLRGGRLQALPVQLHAGRGRRRRGRRHDGLRRLCGHFVLSGLRRPAPRQRRVRHRLQHDRVRVGRRRLRLRRRVRL
mmetsp:Transcript_21796/g.70231  ORF Transcript_21796/g.70231 Transcript_21796/m.70231 type:complete len:207 (-) Transcript_21796:1178-1798(-)